MPRTNTQTRKKPATTTAAPATTEATTTTQGQVLAQTTTTTAAPTTTAAVAPAELALTGAGDLSMSIGLAGAALTLAGLAALGAARRSEDDDLV